MRVAARVAQRCVHAVDEQVGDGVLEHLGLLVDLVPLVAEPLDEVGLEQAVPADHRDGEVAALLGERDRAVALVLEETHAAHAPDGLRDGRRADPEPLGELLGRHWGVGPLLGRPHDLEVVLDDGGDVDVAAHTLTITVGA